MRLSHIHEDDKPQADPLEVRIVVKNDILEELPESDNPLDNVRDTFKKETPSASISVKIWHNTKGKLEAYAGNFTEAGFWPFSRYDYYMDITIDKPQMSNPLDDIKDVYRFDQQAAILNTAHDAWYTMHYANDWGVTPEDLDNNWTRLDPEDDQWLHHPMRSEFTLTWDHFIDIARNASHQRKFDFARQSFDFYPQKDPRSRFYDI